MKLLRKRFSKPLELDPLAFFGIAKTQDEPYAWGILYSYRSKIAHGSSVDFNDSKIKQLKDKPSICKFLRETVAQLLILGLKDEEFISDLRDC